MTSPAVVPQITQTLREPCQPPRVCQRFPGSCWELQIHYQSLFRYEPTDGRQPPTSSSWSISAAQRWWHQGLQLAHSFSRREGSNYSHVEPRITLRKFTKPGSGHGHFSPSSGIPTRASADRSHSLLSSYATIKDFHSVKPGLCQLSSFS